jgi:hypothetical protein
MLLHIICPELGGLILNVTPATTFLVEVSITETMPESEVVTYTLCILSSTAIEV